MTRTSEITAKNPDFREDETEGLVLSVQDYKDADGIVRLLTPEGRIESIYARGIQREKSRNRRLCLPYSKVRLTYLPEYSKSMKYLMRGSVLWYDHSIQSSLLRSAACSVLRDLLREETVSKESYEDLEKVWHGFEQKNDRQAWLFACLMAAQTIKKLGIAPYFDGCVICQRKDQLVALSKKEGGLICRDDLKNVEDAEKIPVDRLRSLRALFRAKRKDIPVLETSFQYDLDDLIYLAGWIEYHDQRRIPSLEFLRTVKAMNAD